MEDISRQITLLCPTCGNDQFEYPDEVNEQSPDKEIVFKCSDCGSKFTKTELIEQNQEVIRNHLEEIESDIVGEIAKLFRK